MSTHENKRRYEYLKLPFDDRLVKLSGNEEDRAVELHERLITIDAHSLSLDPFEEQYGGRTYPRERVRNSGLTCFLEAIEDGQNPNREFDTTVRTVWWYSNFFREQPSMGIAYNADDIREAKKSGRQVAMLSIEMDASQFIGPGIMHKRGTPEEHYPFLDRINIFHELGVRRIDPILNYRNYLGDGCLERYDSGLSYYGLAFVERMNQVGMIVDLAHWGERSSLDAIESSRDPVIISHSGARALFPKNKRLKSDELIRALAEKDGLIGVCAIPNYLSQKKRQGIEDVIDHIDHIVDLVSANNVMIGTDIIWGDQMALPVTRHYLIHMGIKVAAAYMEGIESLEEWPNITRGLISRGYSDQEIEKIVGGNMLQLIGKVVK